MEELQKSTSSDPVARSNQLVTTLRRDWWKIVLFSFGVGVITALSMLRLPNIYRSSAVITPSFDEKKSNPSFAVLSTIGISVGGPSSVEDLETLFKSNDLTVRVFKIYTPWEIVYPDTYDSKTGKLTATWVDRILNSNKNSRPLDDWDAIRAAKKRLNVSVNKRAGTIVLSFDSPSREGSAKMVKYYLEEGKSRLQEEASERAKRNKKFIEEQIGKTIDPLTKDRLYFLYGQEVEREMLARNREQFGFRLIDSPRVPDRKIKPFRSLGAVAATVLSFFLACGYFLAKKRK